MVTRDDAEAFTVFSSMFGVPVFGILALMAWTEWVDKDCAYAERVRRKQIWSRVVLSSSLWCWWAIVPALAVAALVALGFGLRALWRMAFPGALPSDEAAPSQGAYR